eukprot:522158_1
MADLNITGIDDMKSIATSNNTLSVCIGDTVVVTIHTHKQKTGIVCHITKDNSLFIFIASESNRIRILAENINECIKIKQKAENIQTKQLSPTEIQYYITQLTETHGLNHHIIGQNYEYGSDGFPIDFNKAICWYKSGHKLNNIRCTVNLAFISSNYYHNYDKAEEYWNIGIDQGVSYCAFAANVMFRKVPNGKHKELYYIHKYVKLTNGKDVCGLLSFAVCQLTMDIPDYYEAYNYLKKAYDLNKNSIGVQQFLAFTIYRGLGCDKNEKKAIEMHTQLAKEYNSQCSKLWMAVYNATNENLNDINNIHPLRDNIYNSFMDVIYDSDSHGLYYGNWIKINIYHALQKNDIMSYCLIIALKIFGILECVIDIKEVKKYIDNIWNKRKVECSWIKCWVWFFRERYEIIRNITKLQYGLIDVVTEIELSIFTSKNLNCNEVCYTM